jgi:site-specific recombinase XerD
MRLYARTGDVLVVQAALNHRSLASALIYAHAQPDQLRKALA